VSDFVHPGLRYVDGRAVADEAKDVRTTCIERVISVPRHEMQVDMLVIRMLGELRKIGLLTTSDLMEGSRHPLDQRSEFICFGSGQVSQSRDVPPGDENQPTFEG
jgi:hypothetical protein